MSGESQSKGKSASASLPRIRITPDELEVGNQAVKALTASPDLFQRGGSLVDTTRETRSSVFDEHPGDSVTIRPIPIPRLRELLSSVARFLRFDRRSEEWEVVHVPQGVVLAVEKRGHWPGIRKLVGVTEYPVLRPDGTVLTVPGYDPKTQLLYEPGAQFPEMPEHPTQHDALHAVLRILKFAEQFPFAAECHRAAWLTIPLTLVGRHAISGCTPLIFVDANTPGTGKTLLAEVGVAMVTGRRLPRMTHSPNDEETRKRITGIALGGDAVALIDNVTGGFGGPSLDAVLTSTEWSDRALGENRQIRVPLTTVWLATGNNATLIGDLVRRTLHVRLETMEERPEERSGWHLDLPGDAIRARPSLVIDALTILRAYCLAGKPAEGLRPWGSFESWSRLIRGAVIWVGMDDPMETRKELAATTDTTQAAMHVLLDALEPHALAPRRISAAELCKRAIDDSELSAALEELISNKLTPRAVGALFRRMRNRVFGGRILQPAEANSKAGTLWTVRAFAQEAPSRKPEGKPDPLRDHGGLK